MDPDDLLDASRIVTMAVAQDGTVLATRGGFGGFFGIDLDAEIGRSVFERLTTSDAHELATYFIENVGESVETIALPMPFRVGLLDDDGLKHLVDVIASGRKETEEAWHWVVNLVPVALNGSVTRSFDLEMAGADRDSVKRMLCEELVLDNVDYTTRWFLVEFPEPDGLIVHHSRDADSPLADALRSDVEGGWHPWVGLEPKSLTPIARDDMPDTTRAILEERDWRRVLIAPVHVHGRLAGVLVHCGRVPASYPVHLVKRNVSVRIGGLLRATTLLMERWQEQDQLRADATSDSLTGLANSRALADAMTSSRPDGALLFVDVDLFKDVNDRYGHQVGDQVLVAVSQRIVDSCRDDDVVSRVGGDEFVVLLDGADQALATQIGQRIIDAVRRPLEIEGGPDSVSVSIGLSPTGGLDPLEAADQAMLRAKRAGRSRLVAAEPE